MGNKKRATCLAILLQNELNSNVARFTTQETKNLATLFVAKQVGTWVITRAISLLTRFAAMLQNRLHFFGFPFNCSFSYNPNTRYAQDSPSTKALFSL